MSSKFPVVRTRIAPSPTGDPHIGTAYQALYSSIFAKQNGGQFIIRIEDTDQKRYRADSEKMILTALNWLGIKWDEGPDIGGPFGPYRQSERLDIYRKYADVLLEKGHAYKCYCTAQRLEEVRKQQAEQKISAGYDRKCRELSASDNQTNQAQNLPFVIRMKAPLHGKTSFVDGLRGEISFDNEQIDDQVLIKADGFPTYHFAVVVDDHLMQISHIIRGEEWISSTPKHVILYDMFGWDLPSINHLPLLRNADKSKISKRKNPTSIMYYKRKGILPEVLLNFLALMGWNPGEDREIFSLEEMLEKFTWERFNLGGPVFDLTKLAWMNGQYLRKLSDEEWLTCIKNYVYNDNYMRKIIPLLKERIDKFEDFAHASEYFFSGDLEYSAETLVPKGKTRAEIASYLNDIYALLEALELWNHDTVQDLLKNYLTSKGLKPKDVYMSLRVSITGRKESPGLYETICVLGKEIVMRRLRLCAVYLLSEAV